MISDSALTVSQLNTYVKLTLESDAKLKRVTVLGEISNFVNYYKSGHLYFSLKDEKSSVKAVMFGAAARYLKFTPENGMTVYAVGRVSLFERDGTYQLYVDSLEPKGAGELMAAFEQLKKKLAKEGLFDESLKKKIPSMPSKIGVITSPSGAAVMDVTNVLSRRFPLAEIVLCPVTVQGEKCAAENISALKALNIADGIDVILMCRGGGSVEDLRGYNDEKLVREVSSSKIPVITGIGHETDFTLCDFAADLRAPTPSAAAEVATPDVEELYQITDGLSLRLYDAAFSSIKRLYENVENLNQRLNLLDPVKKWNDNRLLLDALNLRLRSAVKLRFLKKENDLKIALEKLKILSLPAIIEKGFAPVFKDGKMIKFAKDLKKGDVIRLKFCDGEVFATVDKSVFK